MKITMNENIKRLLIEIPTIVLSVIIALAINEWNVGRERDILAENVIHTICEELEHNKATVKEAYDYHTPLVNNLTSGKHVIAKFPLEVLKLKRLNSEELTIAMTLLLERLGEPLDQPLSVKQRGDSSFMMQMNRTYIRIVASNDTLKLYGTGNIRLHPASIRNSAWRIAQTAQIAPYLDFELIAKMSQIDYMHVRYDNTIRTIIDMLYKGGANATSAMQDMLHFEKELLDQYAELEQILNN